jgi:prophage regulatory protein
MVKIDSGAGVEPLDQLLWSIKTVIVKTGLSRASIYRYINRERFPPRRRVGPNRVAWVPAEVIAWTEARARLGPGRGTAKNRPATEPHSPAPSTEASLPADAQATAALASRS